MEGSGRWWKGSDLQVASDQIDGQQRVLDRLQRLEQVGGLLGRQLPSGRPPRAEQSVELRLAVGETVILLHPPLPSVGVSIETVRECQQNA